MPFSGETAGDISTFSKRIYYGTVSEGTEPTQKLFIKINEDNIKILNTKLTIDYLSCKVDEKYEQTTLAA